MCIRVHRDKCSYTVQIRQKYIKEEKKKSRPPSYSNSLALLSIFKFPSQITGSNYFHVYTTLLLKLKP